MPRQLIALPLCMALLAAGCGGEEPKTNSSPPAAEQPSKSASGTEIRMVDSAFEPKQLEVKVGDKVRFVNTGQLDHNAKGPGLFTRALEAGGEYTWEAEKPGTIKYVCTFHPGMEGELTVK